MTDALKFAVIEEETERMQALRSRRLRDDARTLIGTAEGRRVFYWLMFEEGALQRLVPAEEQGRRIVASAVHALLDAIQPGSVEEIALEARKQRIADDAEIASAIADRRHEYE